MKAGVDYIGITTPFYCNDGKGNFLLHKRGQACRDERSTWDFGAGQLKFGETVEQAVLREVEEEWGVKGEIQEQLPAHSILRKQDGKSTHWVAIPFFVKVDVSEAKIMEPGKATEMGIFTLNKLPRPLHSGILVTMATYKRYFEKYR